MATNITNCDLEPIQRLGKIQPYGYLLALDSSSLRVKYISANFSDFLDVDSEKLLDLSLDDALQIIENSDGGRSISSAIKNSIQKKITLPGDVAVITVNGKEYYAISHSYEGFLVLEFEPKLITEDIFPKIYNINSALLSAKNTDDIFQVAAREIRALIGYERVLIYKFLEDDSGLVLAESSRSGDSIYLGLRFPESDIPKQARALYTKNKVRIISNAEAQDVDILSKNPEPLDLTFSVLRSVSPMHIQYLANMGVVSSFSISIIYENRLWGLIACHNAEARPIDYQIRDAAKIFADQLGNFVRNESEKNESALRLEISRKVELIVKQITENEFLSRALLKETFTLLDFIPADGAAAFISGTLTTKGAVPPAKQIKSIIEYSKNRGENFFSDCLSALLPEFSATQTAGVLVQKISDTNDDFLIWFRRPYRHEIKWAGEPTKIFKDVVVNGIEFQQINPRKSFETWTQSVENHSKPWTESDQLSAKILTERLLELSYRRNRLLEKSNRELQVAYSEMDNFMNSVSHDISNPLTVIKLNSQLLQRKSQDAAINEKLNIITNQADKITHMLSQFRELSKFSGREEKRQEIDMKEMISQILEEILMRYAAEQTEIQKGNLENIFGNEIAVYQIFSNIIGNAVKYSMQQENPVVKIDSFQDEKNVYYKIYDNGIGISADAEDIFELCERDKSAKDFEGSGIGLSIVKNLAMKQKAKVHYVSCEGSGTCFYLNFKKNP